MANYLLKVIVVCPSGLELEGASELIALGATDVHPIKRAIRARVDTRCLYRLYLQARLPFQILRELVTFPCNSPQDLYYGIQKAMNWEQWLQPSQSFKVNVTGTSQNLTHSYYTALQVKNALVDLQMRVWNQRSSIDVEKPDIHLHLHLDGTQAILSANGCSNSLHRRGWRTGTGIAPVKENLAAGLVQLTGWDGSVCLLDPLCGSGTLLIEAARRAVGKKPRLDQSFILKNWADFDPQIWSEAENESFIEHGRVVRVNQIAPIIGIEKDKYTFEQALINAELAEVSDLIEFRHEDFRDYSPCCAPGLIVCNPPYGVRLDTKGGLENLYSELSLQMRQKYSGWKMWLLSGNPTATGAIRMKARRNYNVHNGGINCRWLNYEIR
ncbi:MAG TPA: class I SAM-dependent RNA methyltransferase [Prochlorococcaceae cyanobacterium AMR_MDS_5431]|nr:class I SAM-dependent RNA methyltransferase [Prochlorococcaceae cyanobacterium AMR_MDS_5431]